jgi:hypothetical protein
MVVHYIFRSAIILMATVRRKIDPEFEPVLLTGLGKIFDQVALTVFLEGILDRMLRGLGRPKAQAVVMLCRNDDALHTRILGDLGPLPCVKFGWIELFR